MADLSEGSDNVLPFPFKSLPQLSRNLFEPIRSSGLHSALIIGFDESNQVLVFADGISIDRALYLLEVAKLKLLGVKP